MKRFLIRHLGNMGDMIFIIPPILETLKKRHPDSHLTFVTAWGFKDKKERWGKRNQGGFSLHLMMNDPHIDQLIHWHDTKLSLAGNICSEDGRSFPTWSKQYYQQQKDSGQYDGVYELEFGLKITDNPIQKMYQAVELPDETYSNYKLYLTDSDRAVAKEIMKHAPHPRVFFLEGLEGATTRGWDPGKLPALIKALQDKHQAEIIWFGGKYTPDFQGRPLTLRENIALLEHGNIAIGVLSGPLHFAASVGLPTLTLYADHPIHRAAPAYFLNSYISDPLKHHRTLVGPANPDKDMKIMKTPTPQHLTPAEVAVQGYQDWNQPGLQPTKSSLSVLTVDEIMLVADDMLKSNLKKPLYH